MGVIKRICKIEGCERLQAKKGMRKGKSIYSTLCPEHRKERKLLTNPTKGEEQR